MSDKFQYTLVENKVVVQDIFNSSFQAAKAKHINMIQADPKYLHGTNYFSLFHTNICSLSAYHENLQTLISNLESKFSVIAVSETWTRTVKSGVKQKRLEGYKNYYGNRGLPIKSGCGFTVKDGITFNCLAADDFNCDILKYKYNLVINEFLNLVCSNFFQPCILEPTRLVLSSRTSLICNIYINLCNKTIHSNNLLDNVTNHMANVCIIEDIYQEKI